MKLYNTLTHSKENFEPVGYKVKMYTCGPTVYSYPHIGNMRAYVFMDELRRTLKYNGYQIDGVMNITDVGHLTSDEDSGDDKMEVAAKKEQKSPYEIAKFYTEFFLNSAKKLNIDMPEHIMKATDNIAIMIELIKKIEANGFTYRLDDGIYFDVRKFSSYGSLSGKDMEKAGLARIESNEQKHHPFDFALWKFVPDEHIMKWDSPWGVGCPGWHIECSAMGMKQLGETIDIHTGGIEHSTVHHENEIAQDESACGHQVVRFWLHHDWLLLNNGKMSKSLGNVYTINTLIEKGYNPMAFKYFCHTTHYRKSINFTFETLDSAQIAIDRLYLQAKKHKDSATKTDVEIIQKTKQEFIDAISDDLNFPKALGIVWNLLNSNPASIDVYNLLLDFDKVLGLMIEENCNINEEKLDIPDEIIQLAEQRKIAKQNKNYAESDNLRNKIIEQGYQILDKANFEYAIEKC